MTLAEKIRADAATVFLRDFAEPVSISGVVKQALVTVTTMDNPVGPTFATTAKIALGERLGFNTQIIHNGVTWVVQSCYETMGLYEHICTTDNRVNYRG